MPAKTVRPSKKAQSKRVESNLQKLKSGQPNSKGRKDKGSIVVEYVLLLVCCVAIAGAINTLFKMDNNINNTGSIIRVWWQAVQVIAEDT